MNKKGITLVEVLVTAMIMGIIMGGVMYFIARSNMVLNTSVKQTFMHSNATRILNMLAEDIREGIIVHVNGGSHDNGCTIIKPDGSEVVWAYVFQTGEEIATEVRITRNGKVIPFIGGAGEHVRYHYVYLSVQPSIEGKYTSAIVNLTISTDEEYFTRRTKVYCRHDPKGYGYSPADWIPTTN